MALSEIRYRIRKAEEASGRTVGSTSLIAVSKVQPNVRVQTVLEEGHRLFGENRVQEASGKWPDFRAQFGDVKVHLIGPLQTNKIKQALDLFDAIHSVDRPKLARKLSDEVQARGGCPELFIQVNTGAEPQKAGVFPDDADQFIADCCAMDLPISGLMVIPPIDQNAAGHFSMLAKIAKRNGLRSLSMGMSSDFQLAVAMGATHVRVGSGVFGPRDYG